jgi:3-methylcrotonyl-CoA carboxylase alpha subunit
MPGLVKLVHAAAGDLVEKGQPLVVLEAMKMEHAMTAPHDGEIEAIVEEGAQVSEGSVLVRFATAPGGEGCTKPPPSSSTAGA